MTDLFHSENYFAPTAIFGISTDAHKLLHQRFDRPDVWRELVKRYAVTGEEWFASLALEPVDLAWELRLQLGSDWSPRQFVTTLPGCRFPLRTDPGFSPRLLNGKTAQSRVSSRRKSTAVPSHELGTGQNICWRNRPRLVRVSVRANRRRGQFSGNQVADRSFARFSPGGLFLFKLHSPNNFIVGGGLSAMPRSFRSRSDGKRSGTRTVRSAVYSSPRGTLDRGIIRRRRRTDSAGVPH
jgi:hypothetical protein